MKTLNTYIEERLVLSKNKHHTKYTLFPESKEELEEMIKSEIEKNGNECSLNHIDVSKITDMSQVFVNSDFNGDISGWDVSNVKNMSYMFEYNHKFNGDISKWDVSKVEDMTYMFTFSVFNSNIDNWNVSPDTRVDNMFWKSPLENNLPKWYKEL